MITLSKNILAFLSESTTWKHSSRPVLQYIYYIPEHKEIVSTDTFRIHRVAKDLWDSPLCFDIKGNQVSMEGKKFPNYKSFFPESEKYDALIDIDVLKNMDHIMKPFEYHSIINFDKGTIRNNKSYVYNNLSTFDIVYHFMKPNGKKYPEYDIWININFLYNALRYFTKTSKNWLTLISIQSKDSLAPQVFHGTIDGLQSSALIMPLKI